ncbi:hypothetical protein O23A_p2157 [Aeromonas salmonicida]|nr:hypothetical protein O23A_p2157 [Aeromonas salmonicida]
MSQPERFFTPIRSHYNNLILPELHLTPKLVDALRYGS